MASKNPKSNLKFCCSKIPASPLLWVFLYFFCHSFFSGIIWLIEKLATRSISFHNLNTKKWKSKKWHRKPRTNLESHCPKTPVILYLQIHISFSYHKFYLCMKWHVEKIKIRSTFSKDIIIKKIKIHEIAQKTLN